MKVIEAHDVNDAVAKAIPYLLENGIEEQSRNGKVLVAPGPVCTVYHNPRQRVLFSPTRNANPFFHLMEALWMLAGRNDLEWPVYFNKRFSEYSDDGKTVWGAYGWRWRKFFGYDQLDDIVTELKENPNSRRCVLSMWNAADDTLKNQDFCATFFSDSDLNIGMNGGKDVPCNTHAYFDCRGGVLNMTVCCRSNDAIWGAYGANVVHFSILQEYIAARIGVKVGVYRQMSNNFHAYLDVYDRDALCKIADESKLMSAYNSGQDLPIISLIYEEGTMFMNKLEDFLDGEMIYLQSLQVDFFSQVAVPMLTAWSAHKSGRTVVALDVINKMPHCDWKVACVQWLTRSLERQSNGL